MNQITYSQVTQNDSTPTLPGCAAYARITLPVELFKINSTNAFDNSWNACANVTYRKIEIFNSDFNNLESGFSAPFPTSVSYPSIKQYVLANRLGFLPAP